MGIRRLLVSLGVVIAAAASIALFAGGSAKASFCDPTLCGGGGGPSLCPSSQAGTTNTWEVEGLRQGSCYSYGVGFNAYLQGNVGYGYEAQVFEGRSEQNHVYDQRWVADGTWHYYYYDEKGTSNVPLTSYVVYFYPSTAYAIDMFYNPNASPYS
jgi:hypothetical protein